MQLPFSKSPPDDLLGLALDGAVVAATDGSWLSTLRTLIQPSFFLMALREYGRAISGNLLLLAQAMRFEEKTAIERELATLDALLDEARALRRLRY